MASTNHEAIQRFVVFFSVAIYVLSFNSWLVRIMKQYNGSLYFSQLHTGLRLRKYQLQPIYVTTCG